MQAHSVKPIRNMVNHDRKFDNAAYLEKTGVFVFQFGGGKAKNLIKNLIENF